MINSTSLFGADYIYQKEILPCSICSGNSTHQALLSFTNEGSVFALYADSPLLHQIVRWRKVSLPSGCDPDNSDDGDDIGKIVPSLVIISFLSLFLMANAMMCSL